MERISGKAHHMSINDVKKNPGIIAELLLKERDVSLIFEKRGDIVSYAYLKTYDEDSIRILHEAKKEHEECKRKGYDRDKAFGDLEEAQRAIRENILTGQS